MFPNMSVPVYMLCSVAVVVFGSYALGSCSRRTTQRGLRLTLLLCSAATPFLCALALFIFFPPSLYVTYNLVPFAVALMVLPVSLLLTLWGRAHKNRV